MAPPAALSLPRRFLLEDESRGGGQVPLEFCTWSFYSAVALGNAGDTLPRQVEAFTYVVGQTVAGSGTQAITATRFHTNMAAVKTIPRPKTFTIFGIRIVMPFADYAAAGVALHDPSTAAANANLDGVDDLQLVTESMVCRFKIGEKTYAEAPLLAMPANVGIGGIAATTVSNTNAAALTQQVVALNTCGLGWDFSRHQGRKPVLWNQQQFTFEYLCQWTTNPTMNSNNLLYAFLDGVLGREVQ